MNLDGAVVEWQLSGLSFQRSPVQFPVGALDISEMLQVFLTQLEMYWYETRRTRGPFLKTTYVQKAYHQQEHQPSLQGNKKSLKKTLKA
ncbi:hypothetical protein DPMN_138728 [Dreissena polymorpha]|uniref:Uncharacterized protein n=1 Tax=Dreissena polymorpha TaxID=45954 RepID=A0A9D4G4G1_DREPO|nr:hypothetical protein DPMN_138728 [Dreissena polymorpha]